jgi:hypothetical protein
MGPPCRMPSGARTTLLDAGSLSLAHSILVALLGATQGTVALNDGAGVVDVDSATAICRHATALTSVTCVIDAGVTSTTIGQWR